MEQMKRELDKEQYNSLLNKLKVRFEKNMDRHKEIKWEDIQSRLEAAPTKAWSLNEMENTGGEPDVLFYENENDSYIFYDCSPETPAGRKSVCYDQEALESRKENKPKNSAIGMANNMDIEILSEEEYRKLQQVVVCDCKTSCWIKTPEAIRKLGGGLFCDRRYDNVFVYHNGAESYYAARGFRGMLKL
jgi:hypothetical protein